jgi:hypothetical protein
MKRVRWVGHPSPFADPHILKMIERETLPLPMAMAFRRFEHNRRISATPGKAEFSVGPTHGFSRTYRWLPDQELDIEDEDYELLIRHPLDRYMFLDVTNGSLPTRPILTKRQWQELIEASEVTPPPAMMRVS